MYWIDRNVVIMIRHNHDNDHEANIWAQYFGYTNINETDTDFTLYLFIDNP